MIAGCLPSGTEFTMKIDLTGKTALVSRSTAATCFGSAKGVAEAGATVIINGRKQQAVDDALARIKAAIPNASLKGVAADLATTEGAAALVKAIPDVDILVNNVGIFQPADFFETPDSEWERHL